jgi:hypothetical protein
MLRFAPLPLLLVASLLGACKREPAPPDDARVSARAKAALDPFKSSLKAELSAALAASPEQAVAVCGERAPALARAASKDGVVVGRSAQKLRSPNNAAPAWVVPVMDELSRASTDGPSSRVVPLTDGRRGYVETIRVGAPCLVCHGEAVAPGVAAAIDARYPKDAARGFKAGDFRGVFWAELSPSAL